LTRGYNDQARDRERQIDREGERELFECDIL
jgi:hypothetical protein